MSEIIISKGTKYRRIGERGVRIIPVSVNGIVGNKTSATFSRPAYRPLPKTHIWIKTKKYGEILIHQNDLHFPYIRKILKKYDI